MASWLWFGGAGLLLISLVSIGVVTQEDSPITTKAIVEKIEENANETQFLEGTNTECLSKNTSENDLQEIGLKNSSSIISQSGNTTDTNNGTASKTASNTNATIENKLANTNEQTGIKSNQKQTTKSKSNCTKKQTEKEAMKDEGFKVTTSYNYYNSETDTASVRLSQQQLDSIVLIKENVQLMNDSINSTLKYVASEIMEVVKDTLIEKEH
jgi:hypothetical protein